LKTSARTVRDLILKVAARFKAARLHYGHGTESALEEAAWLVGHAIGARPEALDSRLAARPTAAERGRIEQLTAERIKTRKPLAYLLHEAWFAGRRFYVDERVLVPRSLTAEFILERFAPWVRPAKVRRILDLCTGSGCMAIALARAFPRARVDAADISEAALEVARINIRRHRLQRRVRLIRSDLFAGLGRRRYDLIVSNPPYVAAAEMKRLPAEYRREPRLALAAAGKGLGVILQILTAAPRHLSRHGVLVVETGNSHARLQARRPDVPFVWLATTSGDESVFLIEAAELARARRRTDRART